MATSCPNRLGGKVPKPAGWLIQSSNAKGKSGPKWVTGLGDVSVWGVELMAHLDDDEERNFDPASHACKWDGRRSHYTARAGFSYASCACLDEKRLIVNPPKRR
jgi:hypothetical protein